MKKFYLNMSVIAILAIMCWGTVDAQNRWCIRDNKNGEEMKGANNTDGDKPQVVLGYVSSDAILYPGEGIGGFKNDTKAGVAIKLPKSMLNNYIGGKVVKLRIGWSSDKRDGMGNIFIKKDIQGDRLASGNVTLKYGWNDVSFDTPFTITEDTEDLFFGFYTEIKANEYAIPVQHYAVVPNSCYLWDESNMIDDKENWVDYYQYNGMPFLQVIVEGDNFDNILGIDDVRYHTVQVLNEPSTAIYTITNKGTNPINKLEINYKTTDNQEWNREIELDADIPSSKSVRVRLPINALSTGKLMASISKVNGVENKDKNITELNVFAVSSEVANQYQRRPLVEFFESEDNRWTPSNYDLYFYPGYEPYKEKCTIVSHHLGDQFMTGDNEDTKLALDFVNGDSVRVIIPGMMVDRTDCLNNLLLGKHSPFDGILVPDFVGPVYEEALSIPTFASIDIKPDCNAVELTAKIDVTGRIASGVIAGDEPLYLTVYVTEDSIVSNSQEFNSEEEAQEYGGVYTHNHLIRVQPTPMYGVKLDANSGDFQKSFNIELEKEWNIKNMKVIAILNRGIENGSMAAEVINTNEAKLGNSTGIVSVSEDREVSVYHENGRIHVKGNEESFISAIYNMTGCEVTNYNLVTGIYLVKVTTGSGEVMKKVAVK